MKILNSPLLTFLITMGFIAFANSCTSLPTYPVPPAKQKGYTPRENLEQDQFIAFQLAKFDRRTNVKELFGRE